jgi:DNA-binding transcriptional ArsR family regulator
MRKVNYKELILAALAAQADLTIEILIDSVGAMLASKPESYRRLRAGMKPENRVGQNIDFFSRRISENAVRVTLSRLKKAGLVRSSSPGIWSLSAMGKAKMAEKNSTADEAPQMSLHDARIMVIFDIPEHLKLEREWLRSHLE